jgi:hypothetical protein
MELKKTFMITILIHEFQSWISVKIFEGGEFPRVRSSGNLAHFRTILREEFAHFKQAGVEVSLQRKNAGKFGGIKWKDIASLKVS